MGKCPQVSKAACYLPLKANVFFKNAAYRYSPNLTFYYSISMSPGYVCLLVLKMLDSITQYIYIFKQHEMLAFQINKSLLKRVMRKDITISITLKLLMLLLNFWGFYDFSISLQMSSLPSIFPFCLFSSHSPPVKLPLLLAASVWGLFVPICNLFLPAQQ